MVAIPNFRGNPHLTLTKKMWMPCLDALVQANSVGFEFRLIFYYIVCIVCARVVSISLLALAMRLLKCGQQLATRLRTNFGIVWHTGCASHLPSGNLT